MALTIVDDSKDYQGSKSPVGFKLTTDKHLVSVGTKSISTIYVVSNPLTTDYLEFSFLNSANYFKVNFDTSLNDEGTNVRTNVFSLSLAAYAAQLMDDFKRIYQLSSRYDFSLSGTDILLTAKEKGYGTGTQPSPLSTIFPRVYFDNIAAAGSDDVYNENYSVIAEVHLENVKNSNTFELVAKLESHPFDNTCKFDLSDTLDTFLKVSIPNLETPGTEKVSESLKRYFIKYYEKYGTPAIEKIIYQTPSNAYVLKGGISYLNWENDNYKIIDYILDFPFFITNKLASKKIRKDQHEFLAYLSDYDSDIESWQIRVKIIITYTDNTTSNHVLGGTFVTSVFKKKDIIRLSSGYNQLGIDALITSGKTLKKYRVQLIGHDGTTEFAGISDTFDYTISDENEYDVHYYLFQNSLGDFDTFCCTGEQVIIPNIDRENADLYKDYEHLPTDFSIINFRNKKQITKKQSSGFQLKSDLKWLEEFFVSTQIYEVVDNSLVPIILKTNSYEKFKSRQTLNVFDFEFSYAFIDTV